MGKGDVADEGEKSFFLMFEPVITRYLKDSFLSTDLDCGLHINTAFK